MSTASGGAGTVVLPDVPRAPSVTTPGTAGHVAGRSDDEVAFPARDRYYEMVSAYRDAGFELCSDLCAVDYLSHPGRSLPEGVQAERFEVVVDLTSLSERRRARVRVQVPEADAVVPSIVELYPGADAMEREAFDLLGVVFEGHPDLTRILMPEDWEGHPLRKDYGVGRVPVQFKEAPGPR
jgi:NADH-quinone oxidoreductase subunit C